MSESPIEDAEPRRLPHPFHGRRRAWPTASGGALCALLGLGAACNPPAPTETDDASPASATSAPAPVAAGSSGASTDTTTHPDAAPAPDEKPPTQFDGEPSKSLPWAGKTLSWPKAKLALRAIEGWQSELLKGYPVVRSPDGKAFVALFGDVGALPPRTHLDMRLGWFQTSPVAWGRSRDGKLGAEHLRTEQREGPGKLRVTGDGGGEVLAARFWAVYVELPGRTEGLLVLAAATDDATERVAELVGMIQSLAVP